LRDIPHLGIEEQVFRAMFLHIEGDVLRPYLAKGIDAPLTIKANQHTAEVEDYIFQFIMHNV
jgi:hypothetical protein